MVYLGKRVRAEEVEHILRAHRELGARRDLRLWGISVGWLFLGVMYCPRRKK